MKVEVNRNIAAWDFPCMGIAADGEVVLFTSHSEGTVIAAAKNSLGYHSINWAMAHFTPFTGSVTLSN